ncbi:MAG TPA: hypothetical protein VHW02_10060 [Rhizomicrobium sp.]|nr:hypothetical protein [Rhizomicrobium sp.]
MALKKQFAAACLAALVIALAAPAHAAGKCVAEVDIHNPADADILACGAVIHQHGPGMSGDLRGKVYYVRGLLYQFEGKLDLAIADYTSAIAWKPNLTDAYAARADAYEAQGQHAKAAQDYAASDTYAKDLGPALAERCWVRAIRGNPLDRALADCTQALAQRPGDPTTLDARGFVNFRMGNYAAAIADYDAVLAKWPRWASSLYIRGLAKIHSGDTAGGNADIAAAKDADYRIAETYAIYGVKQ